MKIELWMRESTVWLCKLPVWVQAAAALLVLAGALLGLWHYMQYHTLRLYNWDGKQYRLLGRIRVRKKNDTYVAKLREHMWDISYTTRYVLAPSGAFLRKNRNRSLLVKAGRETVWLPVGERMRQDIYFRR